MCRYNVSKFTRYFIYEYYGNICVYCKKFKAETLDHIVPLAANGTRNSVENLVASCKKCNHKKGDKRLPDGLEGHLKFRANLCCNAWKKAKRDITIMCKFSRKYHSQEHV